MKKTFNILVMVVYIMVLMNLLSGNGIPYIIAIIITAQGIVTFATKAFAAKPVQETEQKEAEELV